MSDFDDDIEYKVQTFLTIYVPAKKQGAPPKKSPGGTSNKKLESFTPDEHYTDFLVSLGRLYWPEFTLKKNKIFNFKYTMTTASKLPGYATTFTHYISMQLSSYTSKTAALDVSNEVEYRAMIKDLPTKDATVVKLGIYLDELDILSVQGPPPVCDIALLPKLLLSSFHTEETTSNTGLRW
jgi:hypothetical protein